MKRKVGALCAAASITRPITSGTTTAAASSTPMPRSSIPDGPWFEVPRSPAGDIPREVYRRAVGRRKPPRVSVSTQSAAYEQLAERASERHREALVRRAQALAERGRQHDHHQHDRHYQHLAV